MRSESLKLLWLFLVILLLPTHIALADTGPKPTMTFTFKGEPVTIVSGTLYECDQSDCSDATPLQEFGPQRFTCEADGCRSTAYGFAPYHKIEIEFSDGKTRQSNVFETAGFDSEYAVTVNAEDLLVEAKFNLSVGSRTGVLVLVICCALTVMILGAIGLVLVLRRRKQS